MNLLVFLIEAAQQITLGKYKVEILSNYKFKVGCSEYTLYDIANVFTALSIANVDFISFKDGTKVTKEDLRIIQKRVHLWKP